MPATAQALRGTNVDYASSLAEVLREAEAVVVLTAWPEFQQVPELLRRRTQQPVVVDGRRVLDKDRVLRYEGIGLGRSSAKAVFQSNAHGLL